ncbi:sigma-70 family rna polymerase sigma factor : RNA polymerase sigma factor, sigma-70 family OS=Singulisphaera acidiphila (strain ATCC BAA-1392 / DSM 18658 / VKM B-2454 / MOB10) GN=Sinac_0102 PE=4 SV=1: Sigma70_r2: Sigma70_r4_2 [Gemmata massiliana]|uniref:ECF RNA polymerase sigma factor SigE n=1 Tax=Gemmata massiliana TaxID=1210884 RepID=A0A6P2CUI5_9BACT|nr:sigma-70 family RNA polymerase sigma factor [Gemmata massiliana]VTR92651.1 sigma-70 family rna polymerase sigma factor : RNA polymerase sigma factor, sigma-70 family OS=Singulisphaera acidiphila (strain ATCC BAA-1392 / DSM 18658 / VKM B-2454 / MOB10) GN=Sinac_0102 PE=4 SV=1: Sigma70_r2: Sigma70_r4_2 [Gemmata massiliana]
MSRRLLLRLLASTPTAADHVADAELLRRFVTSNDSAALELVARRHADAVWATCRRTLRSEADAEDAFQATFLALVRKAKTINAPCVGGWLHRVAVNAALKLRERAARSSPLEWNQVDSIPAASAPPTDTERAIAVHEELARLPERERLPVVLCDLEGLSHADAAKSLGWPIGTVSGRLSRARAKLRERLAHRGLTPAAVLLSTLTTPPHLTANILSLTTGVVPPAVASLTEGVLVMLKTTNWTWAASVGIAGLFGVGSVIALASGDGNGLAPLPGIALAPVPVAVDNPAPAKDKPADEKWIQGQTTGTPAIPPTAFPELALPEPDPNDLEKRKAAFEKLCPRLTGGIVLKIEATDNTLRKLLKARLYQGTLEFQRFQEALEIEGPREADVPLTYDCLSDMQATVTELWAKEPKELIPWLEELLILAKKLERSTHLRVEAGAIRPMNLNHAIRYRLALEAALWKVKNGK